MSDSDFQAADPWPDPEMATFDSEQLMLPPWQKYPNIQKNSIGWRMGIGQTYLEDYDQWWSTQSRSIRLKVKQKYATPDGWSNFWDSLK